MVEVSANRVANDLRVSLHARSHEVIVDAEVEVGGTDQGPTPHELLAASLAGCTSITVQMYADRKGWPLKSCDVTVRLVDGDKSDANSATNFTVTVSFDGELTAEQRSRLLEIANRCPVHRALMRPTQIKVIAV
jgi:putative redox protein